MQKCIIVAEWIPTEIVFILCLCLYRKGLEFGRKGRVVLPILWVENPIIKIPSDISRLTWEVGKGTMN